MKYKFLLFFCSYLFFFPGFEFIRYAHAQPPKSEFASITPLVVNELIKQDRAVLVDVREWDEVKSGMARPARWMPLSRMKDNDRMFSDFLSTLPKEKLIVLYCAAGKRAAKAQVEMENHGYRAENMGGFSEWLNARLPTKNPEVEK